MTHFSKGDVGAIASASGKSSATASFVLSTGRCGTQWLTDSLRKIADRRAMPVECEHEPMNKHYRSARHFRTPDTKSLLKNKAVATHIEAISVKLESGISYIETGWPAYPYIELYASIFGSKARFLHLYRKPMSWARSMARHRMYSRMDWVKDCVLTPASPRTLPSSWKAEDWGDALEMEKCLFHWTQLNQYYIDLGLILGDSLLRLDYADLMSPGSEAALSAFRHFSVPVESDELRALQSGKVDLFPNKTVKVIENEAKLENHPEIAATWNALTETGARY